jgi:NADH dehydrogenase FAD-containing subunit
LEDHKVRIITSAIIKGTEEDRINYVKIGDESEQPLLPMLPPPQQSIKAVVAVWTSGVRADDLPLQCAGHNQVHDQLQLVPQPSLGESLLNAIADAVPGVPSPADKTASSSVSSTSSTASAVSDGDVLGGGSVSSNIFAIGDCNHILPKSAQNAKQQGEYLANYFNKCLLNADPSTGALPPPHKKFVFTPQGSMIRLSDRVFMDSPMYTGFLPLWVHTLIIGLDI